MQTHSTTTTVNAMLIYFQVRRNQIKVECRVAVGARWKVGRDNGLMMIGPSEVDLVATVSDEHRIGARRWRDVCNLSAAVVRLLNMYTFVYMCYMCCVSAAAAGRTSAARLTDPRLSPPTCGSPMLHLPGFWCNALAACPARRTRDAARRQPISRSRCASCGRAPAAARGAPPRRTQTRCERLY